MAEDRAQPAMQFDTVGQQREASAWGMWLFLATEVLFFGGLFMGYIAYRQMYPEAFVEGAKHQHLLWGSLNTLILLTSSLTMALSVHAIQEGKVGLLRGLLFATVLLGVLFLGIKGFEYFLHWKEQMVPGGPWKYSGSHRELKMYFFLYYAMTGLHALHLAVGVGVIGFMAVRAARFSERYHTPVEVGGLYWHFVDIVWVFLFPLLYLVK